MVLSAATVINAVHWDMWDGAGCQEQLSAGLSDTLIGVALGGTFSRGRPWTSFANRTHTHTLAPRVSGPDIVVLSAGTSPYT